MEGVEDTRPREETIRACVTAIRDRRLRFILVGGAAGLLAGSGRATTDIDLLLAPELDPQSMHQTLVAMPGFSAPQGALMYQGRVSMPIDLLKNIVLNKTYEDFSGLVFERDGVALLQFDAALCIKLHCFYFRQDDENGQKKQRTDLEDAVWYAKQMEACNQTLSDGVVDMFQIGRYHLLLVRFRLQAEDLARLVAIGGKKLIRPWEEETEDQREYFTCFALPGTCPLTGTLFDDSEGDE